MAGEVAIPKILKTFHSFLIGGPQSKNRPTSEKKERRILSLAAYTIFCVTKGKSTPPEHIKLGLVMKSVTRSRMTLKILNRMEHCVSYHTIKGLETELTYSVSDALRFLPDGMTRLP